MTRIIAYYQVDGIAYINCAIGGLIHIQDPKFNMKLKYKSLSKCGNLVEYTYLTITDISFIIMPRISADIRSSILNTMRPRQTG